MKLLVIGLALFVISHLIPAFPRLRASLIASIGPGVYRGLFSLASFASIALIVLGLKAAAPVVLYEPPAFGRYGAWILSFIAIYLFFSNPLAPAPSSAKALTAHPLSWGVICWAAGHLLANGEKAQVILFATLLIYSIVNIMTGNARGQNPALDQRPPLASEAVYVVVVVIVFGALVWGHQYFTGMALL